MIIKMNQKCQTCPPHHRIFSPLFFLLTKNFSGINQISQPWCLYYILTSKETIRTPEAQLFVKQTCELRSGSKVRVCLCQNWWAIRNFSLLTESVMARVVVFPEFKYVGMSLLLILLFSFKIKKKLSITSLYVLFSVHV